MGPILSNKKKNKDAAESTEIKCITATKDFFVESKRVKAQKQA